MKIEHNRKKRTVIRFSQNFCLVMVWIMTLYSSVFQQKYFEIPNGMLMFGLLFLLFFLLSINRRPILLRDLMPRECFLQLIFLVYMLVIGSVCAASFQMHITQLISSFEYLIVMLITAYMIRESGTDLIHYLLLAVAISLALIMIRDPVALGNGRYSISEDSNPNGIGMSMAAGIWAILYLQKKKQLPLILVFCVVGLLGYTTLLTGSRKSLIAAGMTVVLWLLGVYLPGLKRERIFSAFFKIVLITGIGIVLIVLFLREYTGSTIAQRMLNLGYEITEGSRSQLYRRGLELFKANPIFGIGFQGFQHYVGMYSHSTIVEVPVCGGIVGALLYFSSFAVSVKKVIRLTLATNRNEEYVTANNDLRMLLVLWGIILFYCICVIHPYQYDSFLLFAVIFGETGSIERYLDEGKKEHVQN